MSNVKLPGKAGFVPTVQEWDALVRIAENLGAQVVQARQDAHHWATLANSAANERDAARAEVALRALLQEWLIGDPDDADVIAFEARVRAALRQPAPAQDDDPEVCLVCGKPGRGQPCDDCSATAQGGE